VGSLTLKHGVTKVTPFELVYGQEAMLSVEVNLQSCRVMQQVSLSAEVYTNSMMGGIDETHESRLRALEEIEKKKLRVCKAYNRKVKAKSFQIEELVWKRFCSWVHAIEDLANDRLAGKDPIE
jgi:hypothetical protein